MKPDNIYRTLVGISPDLDSKQAWTIWRYIHDLLEDERKETVDKLTAEEIEELRAKKQAIKEELYDAVKMEMFKASSELEGIKTITDEEYKLFEKLKNIWLHSVPEKSGQYFICGEAGDKDGVGLPEKILVCPAYGSDGFAIYTKTTEYSAPEW